ncbi:MAG: hypothetical protein JRH15_03170 [Deltaproteobacteria bacterium]|nr:hypothetical protein [Deltaproteobacteria bacterium]
MKKAAIIAGACLVVIIGLIINASFSNMSKFYAKESSGALEIWRGKFAPLGSEQLIRLDGAVMSDELQKSYTKSEAFSLIFQQYTQKADALLDAPGTPDFDQIRATLEKSRPFAITDKLSAEIGRRLKAIDMMTLMVKAEVLAGKDTLVGLEAARDILKKAFRLNLDRAERDLVKQKIQRINSRIDQLNPTGEPALNSVQ